MGLEAVAVVVVVSRRSGYEVTAFMASAARVSPKALVRYSLRAAWRARMLRGVGREGGREGEGDRKGKRDDALRGVRDGCRGI